MEKHTPGEWFVDANREYGWLCIRPEGRMDGVGTGRSSGWILAQLPAEDHEVSLYRSCGGSPEANARLIAAAPDLLEACQRSAKGLTAMGQAAPATLLAFVQAAIAKAEGE